MLPDRPIAFHPEQARAFGGINDALFFHRECALRRGVACPFRPLLSPSLPHFPHQISESAKSLLGADAMEPLPLLPQLAR
jgi:hypothetical protein